MINEADRGELEQLNDALSRLANAHFNLERFCECLVKSLSNASGAHFAAVWSLDQQGRLAQVYRSGEFSGFVEPDILNEKRRTKQLLDVLHSGHSKLFDQELHTGDDQTQFVESLVGPLIRDDNVVGVVELVKSPADSTTPFDSKLDVVHSMLALACKFLSNAHQTRRDRQKQTDYSEPTEQFILQLHDDVSCRGLALTVVNEMRQLLGCDRASLAVLHGKNAIVYAVSGQERVSPRSDQMRAMSELMTCVVKTGEPLRFSGDLQGIPDYLHTVLTEYLAKSGTLILELLPLTPGVRQSNKPPLERPATIGILMIETMSQQKSLDSGLAQRLVPHVAQAIKNARERDQIFLHAVRKRMGELFFKMVSDRRKKFAAIGCIALLLGAALFIVRVPYRVEARGQLTPIHQVRVFAPHDADVSNVYVSGGAPVEAGTELLRLNSEELSTKRLLARNQLEAKRQLLKALRVERDRTAPSATREQHVRLQGKISQTEIQIDGIERRLSTIEKEWSKLSLRSPVTGSVMTFEPAPLLTGRPVRRGQLLLELMREDTDWQLELNVPAHRIGHVLEMQKRVGKENIDVSFILETGPGKTHFGKVNSIASRASRNPDGLLVVPIRVSLCGEEIQEKTSGAGVIARIECGKRCIAMVLFGDIVAFFKRQIW